MRVRYGCRWESTRREDDGSLTLVTSDGEYRCNAAVFALGVTEPWKSDIPGVDQVPHYADCMQPKSYQGKRVVVIGKRNSGFEIADGLLPWACRVVLVSPRPVQASVSPSRRFASAICSRSRTRVSAAERSCSTQRLPGWSAPAAT